MSLQLLRALTTGHVCHFARAAHMNDSLSPLFVSASSCLSCSHKMTHWRSLAGGAGTVLQQWDAPFSSPSHANTCQPLTSTCLSHCSQELLPQSSHQKTFGSVVLHSGHKVNSSKLFLFCCASVLLFFCPFPPHLSLSSCCCGNSPCMVDAGISESSLKATLWGLI